uniref:Uncharacterized protein n=1 Tax=Cacopsylla melanoneura TaxID=428564 RepID=A0A8D8TAM6_9HEMI
MVVEYCREDDPLGANGLGLLLDGLARSSRLGGRVPADAERHHSSRRRCSPSHRQHVHLPPLHTSLLVTSHAETQTIARYQDKELWIRVGRVEETENDIIAKPC